MDITGIYNLSEQLFYLIQLLVQLHPIPIMKPHMLNNWTNTKDISLKNFMEYASS